MGKNGISALRGWNQRFTAESQKCPKTTIRHRQCDGYAGTRRLRRLAVISIPIASTRKHNNFEECTHAYPPVWQATSQQWQSQMTSSRPTALHSASSDQTTQTACPTMHTDCLCIPITLNLTLRSARMPTHPSGKQQRSSGRSRR